MNQSYHISRGCHDRLTGLLNRRQLDEFMEHIFCDSLHQQRRKKLPIRCIALLDIDHFKAINDNYGHLFGDEVLINIANQMRYCFRQEDGVYRYGGEEFVVVLEYVSAEEAHVILDRFRQHIESFDFPEKIKVTISIGYV
ncbi:MAG: hypothetical protein CMF25_06880 [Kangiellaceae bacterium]|nr:hypothetical protein [Kangiellaceae bacterium]